MDGCQTIVVEDAEMANMLMLIFQHKPSADKGVNEPQLVF